MITIISPAKNMKPDKTGTAPMTLPAFQKEAESIWKVLKKYTPLDLQVLTKLSKNSLILYRWRDELQDIKRTLVPVWAV